MNKVSRNILLQKLKTLYQEDYFVIMLDYTSVSSEVFSYFRKTIRKINVLENNDLKAFAIKNSINKLAVKGTHYSSLSADFIGQNLFIFTKDLIKVSSIVNKFTNDNLLKFKILFHNGKKYDISYLKQLSSVSSVDDLRAKLLGTMSSVMSSLLYVLSQKKELSGSNDNPGEC